LTVHAFVSNLAGNGGYVLVEASDPKVIVTFVSKYNFWNAGDAMEVRVRNHPVGSVKSQGRQHDS
jgi:hypothetical protein